MPGARYGHAMAVIHPDTAFWTWIGGNQTANQAGVYGPIDMVAPSTVNMIGARSYPAMIYSSADERVLVFGGSGLDAGSRGIYLMIHRIEECAHQYHIKRFAQ